MNGRSEHGRDSTRAGGRWARLVAIILGGAGRGSSLLVAGLALLSGACSEEPSAPETAAPAEEAPAAEAPAPRGGPALAVSLNGAAPEDAVFLRRLASELSVEIAVRDCHLRPDTQLQQLGQLLGLPPTGVVLAPSSPLVVQETRATALLTGIPVVVIERTRNPDGAWIGVGTRTGVPELSAQLAAVLRERGVQRPRLVLVHNGSWPSERARLKGLVQALEREFGEVLVQGEVAGATVYSEPRPPELAEWEFWSRQGLRMTDFDAALCGNERVTRFAVAMCRDEQGPAICGSTRDPETVRRGRDLERCVVASVDAEALLRGAVELAIEMQGRPREGATRGIGLRLEDGTDVDFVPEPSR